LLILNNQWAIKNTIALNEWKKEHPNSTILSPQNISKEVVRHPIFNSIPLYPERAALMGLQRSLFILSNLYCFKKITIIGFNFSLSNLPYKEWYPSLIKINYGSLNYGIIKSNVTHDLALNLIYTHKILGKGNYLAEELTTITSRNVWDNLNYFSKKYS